MTTRNKDLFLWKADHNSSIIKLFYETILFTNQTAWKIKISLPKQCSCDTSLAYYSSEGVYTTVSV